MKNLKGFFLSVSLHLTKWFELNKLPLHDYCASRSYCDALDKMWKQQTKELYMSKSISYQGLGGRNRT